MRHLPLGLALLVGCAPALRRAELVRPIATLEVPMADAWEVVGASVEGRPLEAVTLGSGLRNVYLIAGIHGDETGGVENVGRLRLFLSAELPEGVRVRLLRDANPDGTASHQRANARGVDLNRNWPASNFRPAENRGWKPLSEPESSAAYTDLERTAPQVVIVLHGSHSGPFVNFDGPAFELAKIFSEAAAEQDPRWKVQVDMGYPTPGSLGSFVGVDREVPILTVELDLALDAEAAWPALRAGLAALLASLPEATPWRPGGGPSATD